MIYPEEQAIQRNLNDFPEVKSLNFNHSNFQIIKT